MTDELDSFSDAQLSEVFAVEVAGWDHYPPGYPSFSTDANAVLPYLEVHDEVVIRWEDTRMINAPREPRYSVEINEWVRSRGQRSLARCACIALIRSKRATSK